MEEQLAGISAELPIKKSLTNDQRLLCERLTNVKLENVSINNRCEHLCKNLAYWHVLHPVLFCVTEHEQYFI